MDRADLHALIARLDAEISRAGARVRLDSYGAGHDGQITANEEGFLRLGIELLKAAVAPVGREGAPFAVPVDLDYLLTSDSSIRLDWFERQNSIEVAFPDREPRILRFFPAIILSCLAAGFALAVVGFISIARWLLF